MRRKIQKTWGIDLRGKEGHGLMGIYYPYPSDNIPLQCEGLKTATFNTREDARAYLRHMKRREYVAFPKARVVRLIVAYYEIRKD